MSERTERDMDRAMDRFFERMDQRYEVHKGDNPSLTPQERETRRVILANILNREKDPLIEAIEDAIVTQDMPKLLRDAEERL